MTGAWRPASKGPSLAGSEFSAPSIRFCRDAAVRPPGGHRNQGRVDAVQARAVRGKILERGRDQRGLQAACSGGAVPLESHGRHQTTVLATPSARSTSWGSLVRPVPRSRIDERRQSTRLMGCPRPAAPLSGRPSCTSLLAPVELSGLLEYLPFMEVQGRYWGPRESTRDHVSPAIPPFDACRECPLVSARALADVPISYPRGVVCLQNRLSDEWLPNSRPARAAGVPDDCSRSFFPVMWASRGPAP